MLKVTDDSGFLALVSPTTYESFVSKNWELRQLFHHFEAQMKKRSLLIWGTGLEGCWRIDVRTLPSGIQGFREISGAIQVNGDAVLVTNYESLTMVAQFSDEHLPQKHERGQLIPLPNGNYCCRIVQMFDPEQQSSADPEEPDFVLEFTQPLTLTQAWPKVPWFDL